MPALGADMEAGTLVEWLKRPGDVVKRGDIIAVVDTQKGAIEIEVFEDGVLERAVVEPGCKVPVGTVLAIIRERGPAGRAAGGHEDGTGATLTAGDRASVVAPASQTTAPPVAGHVPNPTEPSAPAHTVRARVSPLARKIADELGVDLAAVDGTGDHGAITRADVERAAARKTPPTPSPPTAAGTAAATGRQTAMRAAIAAAMTRAKRDIPHYYVSSTIDMGSALSWLRTENERRSLPDRLLPAALLVKAVARALVDVPELNGHWVDGGFLKGTGIHIGIAIALRGGGLVAPALHDTDTTDLTTLMHQLRDLVARARAGSLKSSELSDATITVTNLGDQGVESTYGIIYPPQVGLVGFGKIVDRPWVVAGRVDVRPLVTVTLSADHRATDGHRGGLLLTAIDRALQSPERL